MGMMLLGISIVVYLVLVTHFDFTQDDAYISFRYAANYLNGDGLVFNAGERVEGYTNFLWTVFMIIGGLLSIDPTPFAAILGMIFGSLNILITYFLSLELFRDISGQRKYFLSGLITLVLSSAYSHAYWAAAGLETAAFVFLVLASLLACLKRSYLAAATAVIMILLRPEGFLVWVFIVAYEIISRRKLTSYAIGIAIITILFLIPFGLFKWFYYRSLLPNSFYAKTTFDLSQIRDGLEYAGRFLWHYLAAGLFLVPAVVVFRKLSAPFRLVFYFIIIYILYVIIIGGDVLKVHRFFVPLLPLTAVLILAGCFRLLPKIPFLAVAVLIVIGWQMLIPHRYVHTFYNRERDLAAKMGTLMDHLLATDRTDFSLATSTIGMVGYKLIGHDVIDLLGLTDTTIARHPEELSRGIETTWKESHFNSAYVLSRRPDYILFSTGIKPSAPAERALFSYSQFLNNYRTIGYFFWGKMRTIYKLYYPVDTEPQADVDVRFGQYYNRAINLWGDGEYARTLAVLDTAQIYSPTPIYPYLLYFRANAYLHLNDINEAYKMLQKVVELDTLVYDGYKDLYLFEYRFKDYEKAEYYRSKTARLVPWYMPYLDELVKSGRK